LAWCTTEEVRRELEAVSLPFSVTWTTPEDPFGEERRAVLDTRAFGSIRTLLEKRHARASWPALIICSRDEVDELVQELSSTDNIALSEEPIALLVFRAERVGEGIVGRDSLTGLSDRMVFIGALQRAVEDPDRLPLSLLLVDLDDFKAVNDRYGHAIGDEVLKETAVRLITAAPPGALVARLGGDEFGILHRLNVSESVALADQIQRALKATQICGTDVTASIGCATTKIRGQSLFTPTDEALYAAKAKGRNRVVHYDEMARRAREEDRDPALESFENRTRVIAERIAEQITRRGRRLFEGLREQADMDGLTGLFGRRYLDRRLPFEFEVSSDQNIPLTVALLDIDHFGAVNKNHGWPSGDKILADVAERIRRNTRADDWAARYGGEEISIVMHGTALEVARPVLERIRSAVSDEPFTTTAGTEIQVTLSGGAAERKGKETLEAFMERISQKLLSAKQGGRNRIVT
jgi:two-component system cell cycle response regulator